MLFFGKKTACTVNFMNLILKIYVIFPALLDRIYKVLSFISFLRMKEINNYFLRRCGAAERRLL